MSLRRLAADAVGYLVHDLSPTLRPTLRGLYQAHLRRVRGVQALIDLNLADPKNHLAVVHSFGRKVLTAGMSATLHGESSTVALNGIPGTTPVEKAEFQVRVLGVVGQQAEVELRLVEPGNPDRVVLPFGSTVLTPGRRVTLEGLEVALQANPKR